MNEPFYGLTPSWGPWRANLNFRARVGAQWGVIPKNYEHVWSWNLLGDDTGNEE